MLKIYQNEIRDTRAVVKEPEWNQSVYLLKRHTIFSRSFGITIKSSTVVTKIFTSVLMATCCPDVLNLTHLNVEV